MQKNTKSIRLALLGGVNKVGGNNILLEDLEYDMKVFLDFGIKIKSFSASFLAG
ncbi:hypothetical protein LCGC14_2653670 [marine sediment metagenome]|uniref:Uncharacterized protein n=1 Tax=marine sediment metagenome TaxID=412755 RepID=A0A0F9C4I0_9ZZZZ